MRSSRNLCNNFFVIFKQMTRSEGVLDTLNTLLQSWTAELKKYSGKDSLGKVNYGEKTADAGGVVWTLFNDMKEVSMGGFSPSTQAQPMQTQ